MKLDLIMTWPDNLDFPLWREWYQGHWGLFNKVIIYFNSQNRDLNLLPFLISDEGLRNNRITLIEGETKPGDWRDRAVNTCLYQSTGDWVWFTEQDFFVKDSFFHHLLKGFQNYDAIGFKESNRLHPACLFAKRALIDKTSKDFSAKPPEYDHFGKFSQEINKLGKVITLKRLGLKKDIDWFHHAGLCQNYNLVQENKPPNYNLLEFLVYNTASRKAHVAQSQEYINLTYDVEHLLTKIKRFL